MKWCPFQAQCDFVVRYLFSCTKQNTPGWHLWLVVWLVSKWRKREKNIDHTLKNTLIYYWMTPGVKLRHQIVQFDV